MAKVPKTIQEQIELLKSREMQFRDISKASHFLANISYYRLKGYWWEMQEDFEDHLFQENVFFEDVLDLYNFDRHFRIILFNAIERIEIALRTKLIYQNQDGNIKIDVRLEEETVWLTQDQMALLFGKAKSTINEHIKNIFEEGELNEALSLHKFGISEFQQKAPNYYNLDVIISVGYRVKSQQGTQFRIWATQRLKEYIVKGFALNDDRFKLGNSMNYFSELQERIREIRLSERFFYQKIKDIYTTSIDYDAKAEKTIEFFKIVQNKLLGQYHKILWQS